MAGVALSRSMLGCRATKHEFELGHDYYERVAPRERRHHRLELRAWVTCCRPPIATIRQAAARHHATREVGDATDMEEDERAPEVSASVRQPEG